jgi:dihydropteroate synthase-like protein
MAERLLFLTGHLAAPRLTRLLAGLGETPFAWRVQDVGVKVAALMTGPILLRRLRRPLDADRVILPGRAGLDEAALSAAFGIPFVRGPDELADLPAFLGFGRRPADLSRHDVRIFAEIVDAPTFSPDALAARAAAFRADGADVIDLGCRPGTPFAHLEEVVRRLKAEGHRVSVDSGDAAELRRGAEAGADFLLSLTEDTLDVAAGTGAVPVLIPRAPGDLASLLRAAEGARARGIACLLDPILDPIHAGFTASLGRYAELRQRLPGAEMLMGTGNLTELTDADSSGVTALLLGICSELAIRNVLVVQVSPHTRRTVAEHDLARRIMHAARANADLPRGYADGLLQVHDRRPFAASAADIAEQAAAVGDANWRIAVAPDGIHVFNRARHATGTEALAFFPTLVGAGAAGGDVAQDGAHAFYLGTELAKAELAWRLGKRYAQDAPLDFGCAAPPPARDRHRPAEAGHTLRTKTRDDP